MKPINQIFLISHILKIYLTPVNFHNFKKGRWILFSDAKTKLWSPNLINGFSGMILKIPEDCFQLTIVVKNMWILQEIMDL